MQTQPLTTLPKSDFFTLQELVPGIYAALSIPGTGSWANAGIVDLGDVTVIFDTFATPRAALDLRSAAETLTGRPVKYVINSHDHLDHVHGNQVFADATIISTALTRKQAEVRVPRFLGMIKQHPEYLDELRTQMAQEPNPAKRRETEILLGEYTAIEQELDRSVLTLPTLTFEDKLTLHGITRHVELFTFGGGHSVSDTFLYLPDAKIAFLADLMHIGWHGAFTQGNVDQWLTILDHTDGLDIDTIVSGHGSIGTKKDLTTMRNYLLDIKEIAHHWHQSGGTPDTVNQIAIPRAYTEYGAPTVFYQNLRHLLQQM